MSRGIFIWIEILQTFIGKNKNWFEISHKNKLSGIMIYK